MRSFTSYLLAGVFLCSFTAISFALAPLDTSLGEALRQPIPAAAAKIVSTEDLQTMLSELGHESKLLEVAGQKALRIKLGRGEMAREAMVAIDKAQHVVIILSGGFDWAPKPARGDYSFYRKLLKINNEIAPSYIFLNEGDVFGLATVAGDSQMTTESLKGLLAKHQERFEQKLIPLVQELAPAPAPQ